MREYLSLECTVCKNRNYRTSREIRRGKKLELEKYCRHCRQHTLHAEKRK